MTGHAPGIPATGPHPGTRSPRALAGVLAAMAVSLTGTRISAVALPWFVLVTTGSATRTGLVAFCEMAPYVLVKALTGPLVDRTGPRTVSWTTDLASASAALAVPVCHAADVLSFPLLLALVAVIGAVRGPGDLAKEVMVPEAAERAGTPLVRATGLSGVTERLASTLGPAAGGGLVALLGPLAGLVVNAACFALGSVIVALALPAARAAPHRRPHRERGVRNRATGSGSARASPSCAANPCCSPSSSPSASPTCWTRRSRRSSSRSGPRPPATGPPPSDCSAARWVPPRSPAA